MNQDEFNKIKSSFKPKSELFKSQLYLFDENDFYELKTEYSFDIPGLQYKDNILYVSYLLLNHFFDFDTDYKEVNMYFHSIDKVKIPKIINELFVHDDDIKYTKYKEFIEIYNADFQIYRIFLEPYESISDILLSQPVDSMGIGTNGEITFMTRRFINSINDGRNIINYHLLRTEEGDEILYMRNLALAGYAGIQTYTTLNNLKGFKEKRDSEIPSFIIDDNFRSFESLYYFAKRFDVLFSDEGPYLAEIFNDIRREKFELDYNSEIRLKLNNGFYLLFGWYINNVFTEEMRNFNYTDNVSEMRINYIAKGLKVIKNFNDIVIDSRYIDDYQPVIVGVDYTNGESEDFMYRHMINFKVSRNITIIKIERSRQTVGDIINFLPLYNKKFYLYAKSTDEFELSPCDYLLISEDHVTTYYTLNLLL